MAVILNVLSDEIARHIPLIEITRSSPDKSLEGTHKRNVSYIAIILKRRDYILVEILERIKVRKRHLRTANLLFPLSLSTFKIAPFFNLPIQKLSNTSLKKTLFPDRRSYRRAWG